MHDPEANSVALGLGLFMQILRGSIRLGTRHELMDAGRLVRWHLRQDLERSILYDGDGTGVTRIRVDSVVPASSSVSSSGRDLFRVVVPLFGGASSTEEVAYGLAPDALGDEYLVRNGETICSFPITSFSIEPVTIEGAKLIRFQFLIESLSASTPSPSRGDLETSFIWSVR